MPPANNQGIEGYNLYEPASAPPWLQGPYGTAWFEAHGILKDIATDGARHAILARFVEKAPPDALPPIASERMLEQMPGEAQATWVARLQQAFTAWSLAGTAQGVLANVTLTGLTNVTLKTYWDWPVDGNAGSWARFWIIVGTPNPWAADAPWGGGRGVVWGDGGTWGSNASVEDVNRVLRQVRLWKGAHAKCVNVIVLLGGELWGSPSGTWGDGLATWGAGAPAAYWLPLLSLPYGDQWVYSTSSSPRSQHLAPSSYCARAFRSSP